MWFCAADAGAALGAPSPGWVVPQRQNRYTATIAACLGCPCPHRTSAEAGRILHRCDDHASQRPQTKARGSFKIAWQQCCISLNNATSTSYAFIPPQCLVFRHESGPHSSPAGPAVCSACLGRLGFYTTRATYRSSYPNGLVHLSQMRWSTGLNVQDRTELEYWGQP